MRFKNIVLLAVASSLLAFPASFARAAEMAGVKLADKVNVGGKSLVLNGVGLRKKFVIKVYVAGLYLEAPSQDAEAILKSDGLKSIEMVFKRDVGAEDITKAWKEGFEKNCVSECAAQKPALEKLAGLVTEVKEGDVMSINFLPTSVELYLKGKKAGAVEDKALARTLPRVWLGKEPPSEDLKNGLLGLEG